MEEKVIFLLKGIKSKLRGKTRSAGKIKIRTSSKGQESGAILTLDLGAYTKIYVREQAIPHMSLRTDLNDSSLIKKCWKRIFWSKSVSKKSRSKGIDGETIDDFSKPQNKNLDEVYNSLKENAYKLSPLEGFAVKKENKIDYRLITAATVRDRIVHKAILCLINKGLFSYIDTGVSYCGVKEEILNKNVDKDALNTKTAIRKLIDHVENKNYYFFKSDIKAFYDNVPKRRLYNLIKGLSKEILNDESLNNFIHGVIFFKLGNKTQILQENKVKLPNPHRGISQGSSLSQFFANIYLRDFDLKMKKIYGDRFIRYIDDFIVICSSLKEAQEAKTIAEKFLKRKSLALSPDEEKTKIVDIRENDFNFLGLNFSKEKIAWKRKGKKAKKMIQDILDTTNMEYYRECKTFSEKILKMNQKLEGVEQYLKYYHVEEDFNFINVQVRLKIKGNNAFKKIKSLDIKKISPIIPLKKWRNLFI